MGTGSRTAGWSGLGLVGSASPLGYPRVALFLGTSIRFRGNKVVNNNAMCKEKPALRTPWNAQRQLLNGGMYDAAWHHIPAL
jgi:hypothetical protein